MLNWSLSTKNLRFSNLRILILVVVVINVIVVVVVVVVVVFVVVIHISEEMICGSGSCLRVIINLIFAFPLRTICLIDKSCLVKKCPYSCKKKDAASLFVWEKDNNGLWHVAREQAEENLISFIIKWVMLRTWSKKTALNHDLSFQD